MTTVQKKHNILSAHQVLRNSRFLVIKIGSVLIRGKQMDEVNTAWMESLAQDIADLMKKGIKVVVVSSGGIALGRKALGIPADIAPGAIRLEQKQAASAVGQYHMFNGYFKAFSKVGITAAQVLLTMSETENRRLNLNARETLYTLLDKGIVPVINENDTVSTGEIRFGDNDRLSVRVAQMIQADTVLLLSTTHGLYTANPDLDPSAQHIPVIEQLEEKHLQMAGSAIAGLSTGGMKSKIEAAQSATRSGISMVIANGRDNHILKTLMDDPARPSSLFVAQKSEAGAKMIWLQSHMRPKGIVIIDDGALKALKGGKSLLPVGVKRIEGHFQRGDAIEIRTLEGKKVGMGISAYDIADATLIVGRNTADIEKILGYTGRDELVHRNDMVLELK
ncbi:MAG: glutamate 5-kinase [Alphaproteobacteria bacterium]|nr:glutamate 5-kinase [Alphaproteobacteria bacterium]QQS56406.1 MAG: glutamate 5-kinase [Alphaproteobacteria bacterium]